MATEQERIFQEVTGYDATLATDRQRALEQAEIAEAAKLAEAAERDEVQKKPLVEKQDRVRHATSRLRSILEYVAARHNATKDHPHDVQVEFGQVPFVSGATQTEVPFDDSATLRLRWGKLEPTPQEARMMTGRVRRRIGPAEIVAADYLQITIHVNDNSIVRGAEEPDGYGRFPLAGLMGLNLAGQGLGAAISSAINNPKKVIDKRLKSNGYRPQ